MSNQNTSKSPGIKDALFNCTGEIGMDSFYCQNFFLYVIFILK